MKRRKEKGASRIEAKKKIRERAESDRKGGKEESKGKKERSMLLRKETKNELTGRTQRQTRRQRELCEADTERPETQGSDVSSSEESELCKL